jgi:hypothetical protein
MVQEIVKSLPSFTLLYLSKLKNQQVPRVSPRIADPLQFVIVNGHCLRDSAIYGILVLGKYADPPVPITQLITYLPKCTWSYLSCPPLTTRTALFTGGSQEDDGSGGCSDDWYTRKWFTSQMTF